MNSKTFLCSLPASRSERVDVFLAESLESMSRKQARNLCLSGYVRINGRPAEPGSMVFHGDEVELTTDWEAPRTRPDLVLWEHAQTPLRILFEDEHLVAVDKPRAMACTVHHHDDPLTLADLLAARVLGCISASEDVREAGLVQRLDFYTSGAVVAAKTREAWKKLRNIFLHGEAEKVYFALVEGSLSGEPFQISSPLQILRDEKRVVVCKEPGEKASGSDELEKPEEEENTGLHQAETFIRPAGSFFLEAQERMTLVEVRGQRMLRHQIRAHLASCGHPLAGDELYGAKSGTYQSTLAGEQLTARGFFLHAYSTVFLHPESGEEVRIVCHSPELETYARLAS